MTEWNVPLAEVVLADEDIRAVVDTYRSGWLSMGPRTEEFEAAFAAYSGARHAIAVTNGTAALHLACAAAGLEPGDEVIVPSLTFVATVNAVAYVGATPVFADIDSVDRPWVTATSCDRVRTERTRAVMTMSYGGHSGDIVALRDYCDGNGLLLLEDAAHGVGSRLDGRHLGTFGFIGAASMFSNKNLAVGEGGIVMTNDDAAAQQVRLLRSHGMTTLTWDRHRGHASGYDVVAVGFNYRIDEPRAALASSRLRRLDAENARRSLLDAAYREAFSDLPIAVSMPAAPGLQASHHLTTIILPVDVDRDAFRAHLAARGIQTSVHYPPVHLFAAYRGRTRLPVTENYASRTVTLPMFANMTDQQLDLVVDAVRSAAQMFELVSA